MLIVQLEPEVKVAGQLFVCPKSPVTCTLLMLREALPVLVSVIVCDALDEPTETLGNVRVAGLSVTLAAEPMPLRVME